MVFKLGFVNETEWSNSYLDKTTSQVKSRTYQFISHKINFLILLYSFMQMVSNKFVIVHEKKFDGESKKDCLMSGQLLSSIIFGMLMYLKFQTALENISKSLNFREGTIFSQRDKEKKGSSFIFLSILFYWRNFVKFLENFAIISWVSKYRNQKKGVNFILAGLL